MKSTKTIIIAIVAIVVVVGVALMVTGSLNTTKNLDEQEIQLVAAASLKKCL